MAERPALSKAEMEVARTLWELREAAVREVHAAMGGERAPDFSTVQTYLRRLETKGYVTSRLSGRTRIYKPRIKPRTVIRETVDEFVERLFAGDSLPLMKHLIEERGLSADEIDELKRLLDEHEEG